MRAFYERFLSIRTLEVPVISGLRNFQFGFLRISFAQRFMALRLALACVSLQPLTSGSCALCCARLAARIAAHDAKLGVNLAKLGIHPGMPMRSAHAH
jgi:hypothetical protein